MIWQTPLKVADAQISGAGQVGQVLTEQPRQETSDFFPGDFMGATMNPDIGGYYFAGQPSSLQLHRQLSSSKT
uniref:Uncharacterized protein n=1 Tax=Sphaerodactylus townsendi TaxID=933632 RepID=A0ACB8E9S6_9SAUR